MSCILIVDDQPVNREFLCTLLRYDRHRLLEAADGAEALRVAQEEHPDLVITDVIMPTMDGYEFVRRLRNGSGVAHPPVILYSAVFHQREAQALAQACGACHFLSKPSDPQTILQRVRELLKVSPAPEPVALPEDFD